MGYAGDMSDNDMHHGIKLPLLRGFMDATSGDNCKWISHMRNRARQAKDQLNKTTCYVTCVTENGYKWMKENGYQQVVHWIDKVITSMEILRDKLSECKGFMLMDM